MASNRGTSPIISGIQNLGKNIERNVQGAFADTANILKGDLNNAGSTLLSNTIRLGTAGLVNPDDINKVAGDTNSQRAVKDAQSAANDQAANDAASLIAAKEAQVASTLAGIVDAQKRVPGRYQTLLTSPTANTLLTLIGNKK